MPHNLDAFYAQRDFTDAFSALRRKFRDLFKSQSLLQAINEQSVNFILSLHQVQSNLVKEIKKSENKFFFFKKNRDAEALEREYKKNFLLELEKIADLWVDYCVAQKIFSESNFLALELLYKIRRHSKILKDKKYWDKLIHDYCLGLNDQEIFAQNDEEIARNYVCESYENSQQALLITLVNLSTWVRLEKIPEAILPLLDLVKAKYQARLTNKIQLILENPDSQISINQFDFNLYGEQVDIICNLSYRYLLENPHRAVDVTCNQGEVLQTIMQSLENSSKHAWLPRLYQFISDLVVQPYMLTVNDHYFNELISLESFPENLINLLQGLGWGWVITHAEFNIVVVKVLGSLSEVRSKQVLNELCENFVAYCAGLLSTSAGLERFFQIVDSPLFFLLLNLLSAEAKQQFKNSIHTLLTQYCNQFATDARIENFSQGQEFIIWEGRLHPENLTTENLQRMDVLLAKRMSQLSPNLFAEEIKQLNQVGVALKYLETAHAANVAENAGFGQLKKEQHESYAGEILAIEEKFSKHDEAYAKLTKKLQQRRKELNTGFFSCMDSQENIEHDQHDFERQRDEAEQYKEVSATIPRTRKKIITEQLQDIDNSVQLSGLRLQKYQHISGYYSKLVQMTGEYKKALLLAMERYIEELIKSPEGEEKIVQLTNDDKQILIKLADGTEFSIKECVKRLYGKKLFILLARIGSGEQENKFTLAEIAKYKHYLNWVELKEVVLGFIHGLAETEDPKKNYKNIFNSHLLSLLFPENEFLIYVRNKIKKFGFKSDLFREREIYYQVKNALTDYLAISPHPQTLLPDLTAFYAMEMHFLIPDNKLQQLLELSARAVTLHCAVPQHFYAVVMHAFIIKAGQLPGREIPSALFTSINQVDAVLALYPVYRKHLSNIEIFFKTDLTNSEYGFRLQQFIQAIQFLSSQDSYLTALSWDVELIGKQLFSYLDIQLNVPEHFREKYQLVQSAFVLFKNNPEVLQRLLVVLLKSFHAWRKSSSYQDTVLVLNEIKKYAALIEEFPAGEEREQLLYLLSAPQIAKHMQHQSNLVKVANKTLNIIIEDHDEGFSSASVNVLAVDNSIFSRDFIAALSFCLSIDERDKLVCVIKDKLFNLAVEHRLLKKILEEVVHCVYDQPYQLHKLISEYLTWLYSAATDWSAVDIKLVLIYGTNLQVKELFDILKTKLLQPGSESSLMLYTQVLPNVIKQVYDLGVDPFRGCKIFPPQPQQQRHAIYDALLASDIFTSCVLYPLAQFFNSVVGSRADWDQHLQNLQPHQLTIYANKLANHLSRFSSNQPQQFQVETGVELTLNLVDLIYKYADADHTKLLTPALRTQMVSLLSPPVVPITAKAAFWQPAQEGRTERNSADFSSSHVKRFA